MLRSIKATLTSPFIRFRARSLLCVRGLRLDLGVQINEWYDEMDRKAGLEEEIEF